MAPRIAVVGSANTDLITFSDAFPRAGETIFGQNFDLGFGGKGANQAIAARLCGAEVLMVARVGSDLFGEATIKNFASFGVDTTHVRVVQGTSTGVAPIFVEPNGQNRIIVVKGANDRLTPAEVDAAAAQLRGVDTIILQFEIPLETIYHTVRFARAHNIRCRGISRSSRPPTTSYRTRPKPSSSAATRCTRSRRPVRVPGHCCAKASARWC